MMKGMVYNLDEASERINTETFNILNLTPRLLCEWGRTNHPETNEPYITVRVAFSGNASHSSKGDITIPYGHYFEVMPHTLFGFEETLSINISQLWDGADVLFIDPPKVTTISDLRVFVDDVVSFINACKLLLADSRQRKLLIQALRNYLPKVAQPEHAPKAKVASDAVTNNWKLKIQAEAARQWKALVSMGCSPTRHSIKDDLAKWCNVNNVTTDHGISPTGDYIYRHVIRSKIWDSPTLSGKSGKLGKLGKLGK